MKSFLKLMFILFISVHCYSGTIEHSGENTFLLGNKIGVEQIGGNVFLGRAQTALNNGFSRMVQYPIEVSNPSGFYFSHKLYVGGGTSASGEGLASIYSLDFSSAEPGSWVVSGSLPAALTKPQFLRIGERVYLFSLNEKTVWSIEHSLISGGPWRVERDIPASLGLYKPLLVNGNIYLFPNDGSSDVWIGEISSVGTILPWRKIDQLPISLVDYAVGVTPNGIFVIGGVDDASATKSDIYFTRLLNNGTFEGWVTQNSFPLPIRNISLTVGNGVLIAIGGSQGISVFDTCYTALFNKDGLTSGWREDFRFPTQIINNFTLIEGSRLFSIGGTTLGGATKLVINASVLYRHSAPTLQNDLVPAGASPFMNTLTNFRASDAYFVSERNRLYAIKSQGGFGMSVMGDINEESLLVNATTVTYAPSGTLLQGTWSLPGVIIGLQPDQGRDPSITICCDWYINTPVIYTSKTRLDGALNFVAVSTDPINYSRVPSYWVANGRIYKAGGRLKTGPSDSLSTVSSAEISSDGTIGTFRPERSMPYTLAYFYPVVGRGRVYIVGGTSVLTVGNVYGDNAIQRTSIYSSSVLGDGTLGVWRKEIDIPASLQVSANGNVPRVYVDGDRLFIVGGQTYNQPFGQWNDRPTVFYTPLNNDGTLSSWISLGDLPSSSNSYRYPVDVNGRSLVFTYNSTGNTRTLSQLSGPIYSDVGKYISPILDLGRVSSLDQMLWERVSNIGSSSLQMSVGLANGGLGFGLFQNVINGSGTSSTGRYLRYLATFGTDDVNSGPSVLNLVSLNVLGGNVSEPSKLVASTNKHRFSARELVSVTLTALEDMNVVCTVLDSKQNVVRQSNFSLLAGQSEYRWDCLDETGKKVFSDIYELIFKSDLGVKTSIRVGVIP